MVVKDKLKDFLPPFLDYVVTGPDGFGWVGVRDDAPQWAKDAYEKWRDEREPYLKDGWKF